MNHSSSNCPNHVRRTNVHPVKNRPNPRTQQHRLCPIEGLTFLDIEAETGRAEVFMDQGPVRSRDFIMMVMMMTICRAQICPCCDSMLIVLWKKKSLVHSLSKCNYLRTSKFPSNYAVSE